MRESKPRSSPTQTDSQMHAVTLEEIFCHIRMMFELFILEKRPKFSRDKIRSIWDPQWTHVDRCCSLKWSSLWAWVLWGYNSLFQLENLIIVNCLLVAAIMVLVEVLWLIRSIQIHTLEFCLFICSWKCIFISCNWTENHMFSVAHIFISIYTARRKF